MKTFVALFALLAVAAANPLPLVQIIVNVDAPVDVSPVVIPAKPEITPTPVQIVEEAESNIIPEPVVMPQPIFPEVVMPEPVVMPQPVLPEVVIPEPVVMPQPVLPEIVIPEPVVMPQPILPEVVIPEPVVMPEPVIPEVVIPQPIVMPSPVLPVVVEPIVALPEELN